MSQRAKACHAVVVFVFLSLMGGNALAQTAIWNNPEGGELKDPANWIFLYERGPFPIPRNMIFDLDAEYTVDVAGYIRERRLLVERGEVNLNINQIDYNNEGLSLIERESFNPPGIIIGSTAWEASLTTDFNIFSNEALIGMSPNASLTTSAELNIRDTAVGGIGVVLFDEDGMLIRQSGTLHIDGPEAKLRIGHDRDDVVSSLTLAYEGDATLRVSNGATATLEATRWAEARDAHATILAEGEGTLLRLDSEPWLGNGTIDLIIRDGAILSGNFEYQRFRTDSFGKEFNITLENGAAIENITRYGTARYQTIGSKYTHTFSNVTLVLENMTISGDFTLRNNSLLTISEELYMRHASDIRIADSVVSLLTPKVVPLNGTLPLFISGDSIDLNHATIKTASPDNGNELPNGIWTILGNSFGRNTISIRNESQILCNGVLSIFTFDQIYISGPKTIISQQRGRFIPHIFGQNLPLVEEGWIFLGGGSHLIEMTRPLAIRDDVTIEASCLQIWRLTVNFEGSPSSISVEENIQVAFSNFILQESTHIRAQAFILGRARNDNTIGSAFLIGNGTLHADLSNTGVVDPSGAGKSISVVGSYNQQRQFLDLNPTIGSIGNEGWAPAGSLIIDIARQHENELVNDSLAIRDEALLGGTVEFRFDEHFVPKPGDAFTFLTAASISGTFDEVLFPGGTPPSVTHFVQYTDTSVTLRFGKHGDLDGDDVVNSRDLSILLTNWGTRGTAADLNNDGTVGGSDLGILLGNWGD